MKKITKIDGGIEINITPTFYILLGEQWSWFLNKKERPDLIFLNLIFIEYQRDYRLDRHNLVFGILGFVVSFRKNVFDK